MLESSLSLLSLLEDEATQSSAEGGSLRSVEWLRGERLFDEASMLRREFPFVAVEKLGHERVIGAGTSNAAGFLGRHLELARDVGEADGLGHVVHSLL